MKIFKWFQGKKTKPLTAPNDVSTVPLNGKTDETQSSVEHIEPQQLIFGCAQSVGKQRDHNEDSIFSISIAMGSETSSYPFGLFVVADGMGGHQYGEVASSAAARTLSGYLLKHFHSYLFNSSGMMEESIQDLRCN